MDFPFTHDLARLISLLNEAGETLPASAKEVGWLTTFAITTRYPNPDEPVSADEHERAVAIAEVVVGWASGRVETSVEESS